VRVSVEPFRDFEGPSTAAVRRGSPGTGVLQNKGPDASMRRAFKEYSVP
jgi:hypothetical protein